MSFPAAFVGVRTAKLNPRECSGTAHLFLPLTATLLEVSIRYLQNDRTNKRPIVAGLVVSDEAI